MTRCGVGVRMKRTVQIVENDEDSCEYVGPDQAVPLRYGADNAADHAEGVDIRDRIRRSARC